jgi:hypothetical protein
VLEVPREEHRVGPQRTTATEQNLHFTIPDCGCLRRKAP